MDLSQLPAKPEKLKNTDWGITGGNTYRLQPNEDKTVEPECDPRDASAQLGKELFEKGVDAVVREVSRAWEELNS